MAHIGLIATDLDGTLIGSANELPLYTDFNARIDNLRSTNQTIWAACTGRTFSSFWEFFLPMRRMGILPDYVIIRHAFIYRLTKFGFLPHLAWNINILLKQWKEGIGAREAIDQCHETMTGGAIGVSTIRREGHRLCLRFDSDEAAGVAAGLLREKTHKFKNLKVLVYGRDVDVRSVPATKGVAISELARHLGIEHQHILTIGNGYNDMSMLDSRVAGMTGCPSNSVEDVLEAVHRQGGHVASNRALMGVMEILDAFMSDTVNSELPQHYSSQESPARQAGSSRQTRGVPKQRSPRSHPLLFGSIAYAGLLVFASFDVLPYSHLIRKPLDLIVQLVAKLSANL
ncbi:MAG: HAD hydrolase family protein [Verrucomicrobia bacterium]|nr:HAD hydrolase family protein [Verrucomicrobiota bacterium]